MFEVRSSMLSELRIAPFPQVSPVSLERRLEVCLSNPSLRSEGDAGRGEAAGSNKPEAYSLEYVEDLFGPRTTQMPVNRLPQ